MNRYDALLEKIIKDREELRRKKRVQRAEEGGGKEEVKDFLDMMLDIYEDENLEMKLTRNHIKALVLVRANPCFNWLVINSLGFEKPKVD